MSAPQPAPAPVISARALSKSYATYGSSWQRLGALAGLGAPGRRHVALADVSFDLQKGESLGLIGENGAGKSTLLKIVAGVTAPTSGQVGVTGRITSLLELGSGFHPEFTGRQNIQLNAALIGLSATETAERTPAILDFAELGEFIDRPVRTYSTGMAMRLGFAIATSVEPDVLIVDEALSVGDGYFQKRCMDRMLDFVERGGTLLFCSHAMYYVSTFCERAIWLSKGEVVSFGPASDVIREYEEHLTRKSAPRVRPDELAVHHDVAAPRPGRIRAVRLEPSRGEHPFLRRGETLRIGVDWEADSPDLEFHLGIGVNRSDEVEVMSFATHLSGVPPFSGSTRYHAELEIPDLPLTKGEFVLYVFLLDRAGLHVFDRHVVRPAFSIQGGRYQLALMETAHRWIAE